MRKLRILFLLGAAAGAAYFLDPEQGIERRERARRWVLSQMGRQDSETDQVTYPESTIISETIATPPP